MMKGREERFLGGSQGGVLCNLAVDNFLSCRSTCRFRGSCYDELVRVRCSAVDAQYWQSWSCTGQHVLEKLIPLSCIVFAVSNNVPADADSELLPTLFRNSPMMPPRSRRQGSCS